MIVPVFRIGLGRLLWAPALLTLFLGLLAVLRPANAEGELHIYNSRYYTNPQVIEKFEQTYDVKVTLDEYETNREALAAVRAGDTDYDIVVTGYWAVQLLIEDGLLAETRPNQMENFKNVDPRWIDVFWDPGHSYSVPYLWGTMGVILDSAAYANEANPLKLIFDPPQELRGQISVIPDGVDMIDAALRYLGKPACTDDPGDLKAVADLLQNAKRHWLSSTYYIYDVMVSGNAKISYGWSPIATFVRQEKPAVMYVYLREGLPSYFDNVVVPKDAKNLENAKLFQNFMMDPEIAAMNSTANLAANAILGSEKFLPPDFGETPEIKLPPGAEPEFLEACPKKVVDEYDAIWTEVVGPARGRELIDQTAADVAIRGYDPVAYFADGRPVKGSDEFAYKWLGATWYFASAEHRDLFAAEPVKYAPQYGGYCASAMVSGQVAYADPEAWRIVDGKLYLIFSLGGQLRWSDNAPENIEKADAQWELLKAALSQ